MDIPRALIRRFDGWLSRIERVEPFTDDPRCILRIQGGRAKFDLTLPDGVISRGADVLLLHAWNERMPRIPPGGPDVAYAVYFRRMTVISLNLIARQVASTPSLCNVQAVGGVTAHISLEHARGGRAMLQHLGFTVFPYHRPFGAFGEFWENFYTWWLMWTYNPASTRRRKLWDLQRVEFWMTKDTFLENYGS